MSWQPADKPRRLADTARPARSGDQTPMQSNPASKQHPQTTARYARSARPRVRFAIDAVIGLAVFFALTAATLGPSAAASLLGIDAAQSALTDGSITQPLFVAHQTMAWDLNGTNVKFLMLAAVFSALFALNNAFVRHLRKAYIRSHKTGARLARRPVTRD